MLKFSLFKIPVTVQWWFFLLAAFLGGALRAQTTEAMVKVLVFMGAAFVSILVHELGHALTGMKCGARRVEIALHGMGGHAAFPGARFSRSSSILTTAAGPGASLALAILFWLCASVYFAGDMDYFWNYHYRVSLVGYFVGSMVYANIFWTIFNLCPLLPLDGGQILRDVLGPQKLKLTCIIGFVTLAILGFFLVVLTGSIFNLIVLFFLGSYNWQVWQAVNGK
ncbi:MAG: site-2 protease family protein [Verrucomicrobiota bacterium]